jgi:DNA-binding MarR family transcriptional regulator
MWKAAPEDGWRQTHLGRLMALASQRFDARVLALMARSEELALSRFEARVLALMARSEELALSLANLAARGNLNASHIQITRHLPLTGCSLTELAQRAEITKQAMGKLVDQCTAWDLVARLPDERDARAIRIVFTATGILWLSAYQQAVQQAEQEFAAAVGAEVATVVHLGLEAYAA